MSETTTWYRVPGWRDEVESVEVVKETASQVVIREKNWKGEVYETRTAKHAATSYFPTEAEAVAHIIARIRDRVRHAQRALDAERSREAEVRRRYPKAPEWNEPR